MVVYQSLFDKVDKLLRLDDRSSKLFIWKLCTVVRDEKEYLGQNINYLFIQRNHIIILALTAAIFGNDQHLDNLIYRILILSNLLEVEYSSKCFDDHNHVFFELLGFLLDVHGYFEGKLKVLILQKAIISIISNSFTLDQCLPA